VPHSHLKLETTAQIERVFHSWSHDAIPEAYEAAFALDQEATPRAWNPFFSKLKQRHVHEHQLQQLSEYNGRCNMSEMDFILICV
jgi:hypothetical protein